MKITIDLQNRTVARQTEAGVENFDLYSTAGFECVSAIWAKVGWNQKYVYTFSWMGRPIIQLPEDILRIQEVVYRLKPDVIIETGVAHGGSLILYAALCKAMDRGRVIGIDVEIRPHNRRALESHELFPWITLVEGNSVSKQTEMRVKSMIQPGETVLVILDSNHTSDHVRRELECYGPLVTPGSYLVVADGIMGDLTDVPRGQADWEWDNPRAAAADFLKTHPEFTCEQPAWPFNESELGRNVTHWPGGWLRRI
jgi:cephalosporin hydroxylase